MHENSDFLRLVVNSIRKDLDENNEVNNCLALHAIANVGSNEMAEALAEDVHRLLISPWVSRLFRLILAESVTRTSQNFVRKKAALTLLRMYRKYPDVIPAAEWALRIISIMDDSDLVLIFLCCAVLISLILYLGCCGMRYKSGHGPCGGPPRSIRSLLPESCG
jgi:AP-2 complex subunit alpha